MRQLAPSNRGFYGWKLVSFLWLIDFLNMGFPLYGGAVINTYMLKEIAMSRSAFGMGFTLLNVFVGIPSVAVAASIVRLGVRKTFCIGSALIFFGALWMWLVAEKAWHYWLGFGVLTATGIGFGTIIPAATAVTRWFSRYRGRAMAVTLSASGIAGFIISPLINRMLTINRGNWRQAWMVVAGASVISGVVALRFVSERPEELDQLPDGAEEKTNLAETRATASRATKYVWEPRQAYRTFSYWMIVVGGIACQLPFFFFTAHWLLHLKALSIRPSDAAWAMGVFTISSVLGRLWGGWLMDRMAARIAFLLGLLCYVAGAFLAIYVSEDALWMAYGAAMLYGAGFGWTFICLNTITAQYYGPVAYPKLSGMLLLLAAIVCSPAGYLGGKIFDLYRGYTRAFELTAAIAVVGMFALYLAKVPVPPGVPVGVALTEGVSAD